jgi:hypothetical protein
VFISHRWDYEHDYHQLVAGFETHGFEYRDYSVPVDDSVDLDRAADIEAAVAAHLERSNYVVVFARHATRLSRWCRYEVTLAQALGKPILGVRPRGYRGHVPVLITRADNQGGPVRFHPPTIIERIRSTLEP